MLLDSLFNLWEERKNSQRVSCCNRVVVVEVGVLLTKMETVGGIISGMAHPSPSNRIAEENLFCRKIKEVGESVIRWFRVRIVLGVLPIFILLHLFTVLSLAGNEVV